MKWNVIVIIVLLCILLIPGLIFTEILAHELYHAFSNKEYSEEICIDFNEPYAAHTVLRFENGSVMLEYENHVDLLEEEKAHKVGKFASIIYLILVSVVLFWFIYVIKRKC